MVVTVVPDLRAIYTVDVIVWSFYSTLILTIFGVNYNSPLIGKPTLNPKLLNKSWPPTLPARLIQQVVVVADC